MVRSQQLGFCGSMSETNASDHAGLELKQELIGGSTR
jgi:hypothetical protein